MGDMVRLMGAKQEAEGEMMADMLRSHGITVVVKRDIGQDVPGMLAGGWRQIMVPRGQAEEAMEILQALQSSVNETDPEADDAAQAEGTFSSSRRAKGILMLALYCLPVALIVGGALALLLS